MPGFRTVCLVFAGLSAVATRASAQTTSVASPNDRAQVIAASFNKSKHVAKEKRGVRKEKYLDVRSVPALRVDPASYSGAYEVADFGFSLQLTVASNGSVQGTGYETLDLDSGVKRSFTLRDARVDGALLTGTKIFANGDQERFEGVFIDRTVRESPNDKGATVFGLGVIGKAAHLAGLTIDKFFYQHRVSGAAQ